MPQVVLDLTQVIIAVGTLFIATLAFYHTYRQGKWQRQHAFGSIRPLVLVHFNFNSIEDGKRTKIDLTMSNVGPGSAVIDGIELTNDGKPITFKDLGLKAMEGRKSQITFFENDGGREALSSGKTLELLSAKFETSEEKPFEDVIKNMGTMELRVEYTCVMGQRYRPVIEKGESLLSRFDL